VDRVSIDRSLRSYEIKTALITGASSGIGLEFASWLLEVGCRVVAASRNAESSEDLRRLKAEHGDRLSVHRLDVGDTASRRGFFEAVSKEVEGLDLLINAAGIISGDEENTSTFGDLDQSELSRTLLINSIAPLMMTEGAFPLLKKGTRPVVVNISSLNGSISLWSRPGKYSYCASKAALNMITKTLSIELRDAGILVVSLHPGWVKTWMTRNEDAPMEPAESIGGMVRVIESLGPEDSGKFLDWQGNEVPW
jgi:NAD(P)-dependent dehydrogenase (short-subunit alcohol dehydrogenase family)